MMTRVQQICRRIYSLDISEIAYGEHPPTVVGQIIDARWGSVPRVSTTEFALVAPEIGEAKDEAERLSDLPNSELEKRGVKFDLIDADLRCIIGKNGVLRAILRWLPCSRSLDAEEIGAWISLKKAVKQVNPNAANFSIQFLKKWQKLWFNGLSSGVWMEIAPDDKGRPCLVTGGHFITQGLAELKRPRLEALQKIKRKSKLKSLRDWGKGDLCVFWKPDQPEQAAELLSAYFNAMVEVGFGDRYRWHRRPKTS